MSEPLTRNKCDISQSSYFIKYIRDNIESEPKKYCIECRPGLWSYEEARDSLALLKKDISFKNIEVIEEWVKFHEISPSRSFFLQDR